METTALLIKSKRNEKSGERALWHEFTDVQAYILGIVTSEVSEEIQAEVLNMMVSGVPTPWARARLFKYAMDYTSSHSSADKGNQGLINYYKGLIGEWKGLIACLALFPQDITISEQILLNNRLTKEQTRNTNELFGLDKTLGRMLFDDADLWTSPEALANHTIDAYPFIQLIYYKDKLIGGTSPYSLVFTGMDYQDLESSQRISWYRNGKLNDPLGYPISNEQLQKLFLLVNNIRRKIDEFEDQINIIRSGNTRNQEKKRQSLISLKAIVQEWLTEIEGRISNLKSEGSLDAELPFKAPYYELFNIKKTLYALYINEMFSGEILLKKPESNEDYIKVDDAKELLMDSDYIIQFRDTYPDSQPLEQAPAYYLQARNIDGEKAYFPLPLSKIGLYLFQNILGSLLTGEEDSHNLIGEIIEDTDTYKLRVELQLSVQNQYLPAIVREYDIESISEVNKNVVLFPNFTSKFWRAYYYYSELPINNNGLRAYPLFKMASNQSKIFTDNLASSSYDQFSFISPKFPEDKDYNFVHPLSDHTELKIERLIRHNPVLNSSSHKCEIFKSNYPIAGLEIKQTKGREEYHCGYLIIKQESNIIGREGAAIKDYSDDADFHPNQMKNVDIGLDFGSNNTCISYREKQAGPPSLMKFSNRRVVVIGHEVLDPKHEYYAQPFELLFFQNEPIQNGQIKSWIHDHDNSSKFDLDTNREIAAGVPIFEPNIRITNMAKNGTTMFTPTGKMYYNLKWKNDANGMNRKTGYWQTIWLKICAELFIQKLKPERLLWSYPGALSKRDVNQYATMYDTIIRKTPIKTIDEDENDLRYIDINVTAANGEEALTESEAVCHYALTKVTPSKSRLLIGVDIGGSTSDILLLASLNSKFKLISQSSIRLAANQLVKTVALSAAIRKAIDHFIEHEADITIKGISEIIDHPEKTPYYLNVVFDRIPNRLFKRFYKTMASSPRVQQKALKVFSIPAYISGFIAFYSGQLVSYTRAKKDPDKIIQNINNFTFFPFGKGGRLFNWLTSHIGEKSAYTYYQDCFKAGMALDSSANKSINLHFKDDYEVRLNTKAEVSLGLSAVKKDIEINSENDFICGEKGIDFQGKTLEHHDIMEPYLFKNLLSIDLPDQFECFQSFLDIFIEYMGPKKHGILEDHIMEEIKAQIPTLRDRLINFIDNDNEYNYIREQKGSFSFSHPMIVLEAMCFLEKVLLVELFKQHNSAE